MNNICGNKSENIMAKIEFIIPSVLNKGSGEKKNSIRRTRFTRCI